VLKVMLKGAFNMCRHAADHFRKQESGSFIHITSTSGLIGAMGQVNYGAAKMGLVGLSKNIAVDMQRFKVRSNCIAPVAWTRMTASIPPKDPAAARRMARYQQITAEHNAPLAVFLASDAAAGVTGQIFSVRKNEIFLMSQSRPLRGIHRSEGWTPDACADHLLPALKPLFYPLDRTSDVFSWDSI
jgi:NAD(P)-dependent dehydrogenase (short-subunit alcohol dehydrogenase family)